MDIEEYRPEPPRYSPPTPPRKDRSKLIMGLVLAGTFLGTLAFLDRHELADSALRLFSPKNTPGVPAHVEHFSLPAAPGAPGAEHPPVNQAANAAGQTDVAQPPNPSR
jgi:hypothetical protein